MVTTTDLVSYYKCDVDSSTVTDSHGSSDGTATNFSYTSSGKINGGFRATGGTAGKIDIGLSEISNTDDYSWSLWVYDEGADDTLVHYIVHLRGSFGIIQLGIGMDGANNNALTARAYDGAYSYTYYGGGTPSAPPKNQWYHVVFTVEEGNEVKLYVNGSLEDTEPYGTHQSFSAVGYSFGGNPSGGQSHDGTIDEIAYFDVAITQQDVTDLYNSGNGLAYPFTGATASFNSVNHGHNQ